MSVCFVSVRIELESDARQPADFSFSVRKRPSRAVDPKFYYDSKEQFLDAVVALRGKRSFREYIIETYVPALAQKAMEDIPMSERPPARLRTTSTARSEHSEDTEESHAGDEYFVQFYYGNPNVEMVKGVLHLFRDNERTSLKPNVSRSTMLCMLSVPAYFSTSDLLRFIAPFSTEIERLKIIRDQTPSQYMVLIRIRTQEAADRFYSHFNGVPFNSIEPGICHLAYVAKIDAVKDIEGGGMAGPGVTELPECIFCMESLDEAANGVLTILCNHSFHSACMQRDTSGVCPVCRYFQIPQMVEEQTCFHCGMTSDDLWLCLICGNVGCGRYSEKHAFVHFQETQHTYALNVKTQRVWDYVGDGYVHRLIQGQESDKMVEVQDGTGNLDEKMESITLEYTYLLTTQLESQRHFFEEHVDKISKQQTETVNRLEKQFEEATKEKDERISRLEKELELTRFHEINLSETIEGMRTKEKDIRDKKLEQLTARLVKVTKDLETEKLLSRGLSEKQKKSADDLETLARRNREKDEEIASLNDQLRDLMYHMQAQEKIAELPENLRQDIEGGNVSAGATQTSRTGRRSNPRRQ